MAFLAATPPGGWHPSWTWSSKNGGEPCPRFPSGQKTVKVAVESRRWSRPVKVATPGDCCARGGLWWSVGSEGIQRNGKDIHVGWRFMQTRPSKIKPRSDSREDSGEGASAAGFCRNSNALQKGGCSLDEGRIATRLKRGTCSWGFGGGLRHVIVSAVLQGGGRLPKPISPLEHLPVGKKASFPPQHHSCDDGSINGRANMACMEKKHDPPGDRNRSCQTFEVQSL